MGEHESVEVNSSMRVASYRGEVHFEFHGRRRDGEPWLSQGLIMSPGTARAAAAALVAMADHAEVYESRVEDLERLATRLRSGSDARHEGPPKEVSG